MDTDAVVARRPDVVLVDELAHTNAPGSAHEKRWQDVEQLLAAGIDVITTVNIQHLESLNDVVAAITGIKQAETVPDEVVRAAEQIELVDMTPQALRRRMAHGHIYPADRIDTALGNYFREGNLTALRELALLWVADRVEEGLDRYRAEHGIQRHLGRPRPDRGRAHRRSRRCHAAPPRRPDRRPGRRPIPDRACTSSVPTAPPPPPRPRSNSNVCSPRTSAAACNSSSATTSPRRCWNSPGRSTAPRSSSGASRHGRLAQLVRPSVANAIVSGSGDIDVYVVTHPTRRPDARIPGRLRAGPRRSGRGPPRCCCPSRWPR